MIRRFLSVCTALICILLLASCKKSSIPYNETTGYQFSECFEKSESKVLKNINELPYISNLTLFNESDMDGISYRSYSLEEATQKYQYITYLSFEKRNNEWQLCNYEKIGTLSDSLSEKDMQNLSKEFDRFCGTYGEPDYNDINAKTFSAVPDTDHPIVRSAGWSDGQGNSIAIFSLQFNHEGNKIFVSETEAQD